MIISGINFAELERPAKWIKFPIDFFEQPIIKKLRRHAGGDSYTILYQKVMLYSARWGGLLPVKYEKSLLDELALVLDESERDLNVLLSFLEANALLNEEAPRVYLLTQVPSLIGKDGESTERVKRFRERKRLALGMDTGAEKKTPKTAAERVREHRMKKRGTLPSSQNTFSEDDSCNGDVTKSVTPCNENVTDAALHVTKPSVTGNENVTDAALHVTEQPVNDMAYKSHEYCDFDCNEKCNVTCNVTETLHVTDETLLRYKREERRERDNITPLPPKGNGRGDLKTPLNVESISMLHGITEMVLEEYLNFRKNSGGVVNPFAFEKHLFSQLSELGSEESGFFAEWLNANENEQAVIESLSADFMALSPSPSKKSFVSLAKESFDQGWHKLAVDYGEQTDRIISIVIEIAYQRCMEFSREPDRSR